MFDSSYLEGRKLHLQNKLEAINNSLSTPMPEEHLIYKVTKLVPAVKQALNNIQTGEYGICTICKEEIDTRRLNIRPEAMTCVSCAKRRPNDF